MRLLFFNKQTVFNYSSLILKLSSHIFCKTNSTQLFTCHLLIIICRPVSITLGCLYIFFPLSSLFLLCFSQYTWERLQFYQSIVYCKRSAIDGLIKRSSSKNVYEPLIFFFVCFGLLFSIQQLTYSIFLVWIPWAWITEHCQLNTE